MAQLSAAPAHTRCAHPTGLRPRRVANRSVALGRHCDSFSQCKWLLQVPLRRPGDDTW